MAKTATLTEQQQRARWNLLLTDLEHRREQSRQMKSFDPLEIKRRITEVQNLKTFKPWQIALASMTAGATLFAAGAALTKLLAG